MKLKTHSMIVIYCPEKMQGLSKEGNTIHGRRIIFTFDSENKGICSTTNPSLIERFNVSELQFVKH